MGRREHPRYHDRSHHGGGFLLGALIGAILGVLYAPAPGEETRKKLKEIGEGLELKGKKAYKEAETIATEVKEVAAPLLEEVEKNVGPVLKKAKKSGKEVHEQVLEKIEMLVDEVEDVGKDTKKYFKGIKK